MGWLVNELVAHTRCAVAPGADARAWIREPDRGELGRGSNYRPTNKLKLGLDVVWALDAKPTDSLNAAILADGSEKNQSSSTSKHNWRSEPRTQYSKCLS